MPHLIALPPSKSISARALVINALTARPCALQNLSDCDDTRALQAVLHGGGDIGAAGTAMRFSTALLAATAGSRRTLTGTARMLQRPIGPLVGALRQLGADIDYAGREGFPPLRIRGRHLGGGEVSIAANVSSQYLSALMMVGPALSSPLTLRLQGPIASRPYLEMTRALMAAWGAQATWLDDHSLYIYARPYTREKPYAVEPDWSAASYFFSVAATHPAAPVLLLGGLTLPSVQGDSRVADLFRTAFGVEATPVAEGLRIRRVGQALPPTACLEADFADIPDVAQTLVVACALAGRPFRFTGLESLKIKETDRVAALRAECAKLGWTLTEPAEGTLEWDGRQHAPDTAAQLLTYEDHRMAMAFAPCLLRWPALRFDRPEVVSKSFPAFWQEFHRLRKHLQP